MSILFVGDIHGCFGVFKDIVDKYDYVDCVIQVGDFGMYPPRKKNFNYFIPSRKIYWIEGNHEYFPDINGIVEPTEVYKNCIYIPRGEILELDNRTICFLGGGESVDKHTRTFGVDWFPEESITQADVYSINFDQHIDILVTHVPPEEVVCNMLPHKADNIKPSSKAVQTVWENFGRPTLVCGHMHSPKRYENVFVLPEFGQIIL